MMHLHFGVSRKSEFGIEVFTSGLVLQNLNLLKYLASYVHACGLCA